MADRLHFKVESHTIQGACVQCEVNKQQSRGGGRYRALCGSCHRRRYSMNIRGSALGSKWKYRKHLKVSCEVCAFIPVHTCQLDIDHVDGDHENNMPSNLMTLCANCHRLKTLTAGDYLPRNKEKVQ